MTAGYRVCHSIVELMCVLLIKAAKWFKLNHSYFKLSSSLIWHHITNSCFLYARWVVDFHSTGMFCRDQHMLFRVLCCSHSSVLFTMSALRQSLFLPSGWLSIFVVSSLFFAPEPVSLLWWAADVVCLFQACLCCMLILLFVLQLSV